MCTELARWVCAVRHEVAPRHETAGDSALLGRWVEQGDQSAFELLLHRHGPMVWDTCRRVLRHEQDAEDAFQAAFLTLARKASSIRQAPCLAGWLYRVAHRTALAARARPERAVTACDLDELALSPEGEVGESWRELLDEELNRLPDRYREPFVLCYLEGRTTDEAARALNCPRGTVGTRLAWARQRLRQRLQRRGVEVPACMVTAVATLPGSVVESALQTVSAWVGREAVLPAVASLCEEVIRVMLLNKLKSVTLWLAPLFVLVAGGGWWLDTTVRADKPAKPDKPAVKSLDKPVAKPDKPTDKPGDRADKPGRKKGTPADVNGIVQEVSPDQKTVTVVIHSKTKGEEPKTVTLKFDDKAKVLFTNVGPDGARVSKGQHVSAWLAENSKDSYARVLFNGSSGKGEGPSVSGQVSGVASDGKSFTLTLSGKKKCADDEDKPKEATIKLTPKTTQLFNGVGPGEAKLVKGLNASVWLAKGSKDSAAQVQYGGPTKMNLKGEGAKPPSYLGQVVAVAGDSKSFTVQVKPKAKGEEATTVEVKLGSATKQMFANVGPGEASPKTGYQAWVWLDDKAKDGASQAAFFGHGKGKQPTVTGVVKAVAGDGKSFTIHLPGKKGQEGTDVEVKLGRDAQVLFRNVPAGAARITTGYQAHAVLEEDSKDTAASVVFAATGEK